MAIDTASMLTLMQETAEAVINPRFRELADDEISSKAHPGDLVTVADQEAEVLLTKELRSAYPDALILGEEAFAAHPALRDAFGRAEHAFTVDPVDGTRNFVHGSPDHAVMMAEVRGGQVVRSWIWQPQHGTAYVAERGAGAYRDGERLPRLEVAADEQDWRVRTSAPPLIGKRLGASPPMELTWLSCGVDYPKLAEGECDALVYRGTMPWDHAPGSLLLDEVGGIVIDAGDRDGQAYGPRSYPRGIVAGASREMVRTLASHLDEVRSQAKG